MYIEFQHGPVFNLIIRIRISGKVTVCMGCDVTLLINQLNLTFSVFHDYK